MVLKVIQNKGYAITYLLYFFLSSSEIPSPWKNTCMPVNRFSRSGVGVALEILVDAWLVPLECFFTETRFESSSRVYAALLCKFTTLNKPHLTLPYFTSLPYLTLPYKINQTHTVKGQHGFGSHLSWGT